MDSKGSFYALDEHIIYLKEKRNDHRALGQGFDISCCTVTILLRVFCLVRSILQTVFGIQVRSLSYELAFKCVAHHDGTLSHISRFMSIVNS